MGAEKKGLSLEDLRVLVGKWQKKLKMADWKFDIKIVDFKNKNNYRKSGDFVANPRKKKTNILITFYL